MDLKTFERYEEVAYKLFFNSIKQNRLSQAYILYGERNAPLKECAFFLAKSLNCKNGPLACSSCSSCKKFDEGIRPDFVFIDGEDTRIKKEDILSLQDKMSYSAYEDKHRLCYVVNRIENITEIAANSALKFLEEPKEGQVAFLTTYNLDRVLPTILSRSIAVRIDPIEPLKLEEKLRNQVVLLNGKDKHSITDAEAYLLSQYFPNEEEALSSYENQNFYTGYQAAEEFLSALSISNRQASETILHLGMKKLPSACYNFLYLIVHDVVALALLGETNNPFKDVIKASQAKRELLFALDEQIKDNIASAALNYNPILQAAQICAILEGEKR